jgi:hypothetical protein
MLQLETGNKKSVTINILVIYFLAVYIIVGQVKVYKFGHYG